MVDSRLFNASLVAVSATALALGGAAHGFERPDLATWLWVGSSVLVLLVLLVEIGAALLRRQPGLDLIALLSIGGAIYFGEFLTAAVIALMLASGRALESLPEERARREMSALLAKVPRSANRYDGDKISTVPLEEIQPGDRLLVRQGEAVPVDGRLLGTAAILDEAALTGEPLPVTRGPAATVSSGAVNAGHAFDMRALATAENSTFMEIVRLVGAAQKSKAPAMRLADRYALLFVPITVVIAGAAWFFSGDPIRTLAVLVVATPCPLILAVPVAMVCAMSSCARRGVLIKHGAALEKLAQSEILFFDKTGTLTVGHARLVDIVAEPPATAEEVLTAAASLDQMSGHAIAQAVVNAASERGLTLSMPDAVREEPGAGVAGTLEGRAVRVGAYEFVCDAADGAERVQRLRQRIGYEGASGAYVSIDGKVIGALHMADEIRLDTPRALRLLRANGIRRIVMLTGDRSDVAQTIGGALGVDQVLAEQKPADKLRAIGDARSAGITVMVGDGVNDAPALAAADVGVAMGARGAAAAAEAAQVVLVVDRLDRLAYALQIARSTRAIALQSVIAGMGLSLIAMVVAAFGYLPPVAGAILQEIIDVAVIINALRVVRLEPAHGAEKIAPEELARLRAEHAELAPIIDRIGALADQLATLPPQSVLDELERLNTSLQEHLLPHEAQDDAKVYPEVARLIGGIDPMGAMSRTHREIFRLGRQLRHLGAELSGPGGEGVEGAGVRELQRTLYALDAILRLHFAQEEEIYHGLA